MDNDDTRMLQRKEIDGEVFVSLADMLYLTEVSRDRHALYGHDRSAVAMENFASALSLMLMVQ